MLGWVNMTLEHTPPAEAAPTAAVAAAESLDVAEKPVVHSRQTVDAVGIYLHRYLGMYWSSYSACTVLHAAAAESGRTEWERAHRH